MRKVVKGRKYMLSNNTLQLEEAEEYRFRIGKDNNIVLR